MSVNRLKNEGLYPITPVAQKNRAVGSRPARSRQGSRVSHLQGGPVMASFSVVTNIAASNAQANLYSTNVGLRQALNRVSSGFRINYSGDDAAGLAVANSYRSKVAIINQGVRNANDAPVRPADQGRRARQHLASCSTAWPRWPPRPHRARRRAAAHDPQQRVPGRRQRDRRGSSRCPASTGGSTFSVFVSNESTAADGIVIGHAQRADRRQRSGVDWPRPWDQSGRRRRSRP